MSIETIRIEGIATPVSRIGLGTWAIGAFIQGSKWQPGVDFGAVTFPQKPERILLFHPDTYGITVKAPHPAATKPARPCSAAVA